MEQEARQNDGMNGEHQWRIDIFQMPVNYPKYTRADYEAMPEWKLDCLLSQYGLSASGDVDQKRKFAIGAFLWALH